MANRSSLVRERVRDMGANSKLRPSVSRKYLRWPMGRDTPGRDERFPRRYRLKRRRLIRALFDRSRTDTGTVAAGCVRLVFRIVAPGDVVAKGDEAPPVQAGFAPGKCPTAVARNRVRRLLRESYRRHQHLLRDLFAERPGEVLTLMAIFRGDPRAPESIHRDLPRALEKAVRDLSAGDGREVPAASKSL